jgi:hypothetical protein
MFKPIIKLEINDHDYEIEFNYLPPEKMEKNYPGALEDIELLSVKKDGKLCTKDGSAWIMNKHYDEVKEAIEEKIRNYNRMMEESSYE